MLVRVLCARALFDLERRRPPPSPVTASATAGHCLRPTGKPKRTSGPRAERTQEGGEGEDPDDEGLRASGLKAGGGAHERDGGGAEARAQEGEDW